MAILKPLSLLGALAMLVACDPTRPSTLITSSPDRLLVYSVLTAGGDTVSVALRRVGVAQDGRVAVSGAHVVIGDGVTETVLTEAPTGFARCLAAEAEAPVGAEPGCYAAVLPRAVQAGARYTLRVTTSAGETVQGETHVPTLPTVVRPAPGERIAVTWSGLYGESGPLRLEWSVPAGAATLLLRLHADTLWAGAQRTVAQYCGADLALFRPFSPTHNADGSTSDTLTTRLVVNGCGVRPAQGGDPVAPDSVDVSLTFAALDSAVTAYSRVTTPTLSDAHASYGITGAWGVFGSAAPLTRRIRIVKAPPQ